MQLQEDLENQTEECLVSWLGKLIVALTKDRIIKGLHSKACGWGRRNDSTNPVKKNHFSILPKYTMLL